MHLSLSLTHREIKGFWVLTPWGVLEQQPISRTFTSKYHQNVPDHHLWSHIFECKLHHGLAFGLRNTNKSGSIRGPCKAKISIHQSICIFPKQIDEHFNSKKRFNCHHWSFRIKRRLKLKCSISIFATQRAEIPDTVSVKISKTLTWEKLFPI